MSAIRSDDATGGDVVVVVVDVVDVVVDVEDVVGGEVVVVVDGFLAFGTVEVVDVVDVFGRVAVLVGVVVLGTCDLTRGRDRAVVFVSDETWCLALRRIRLVVSAV